MGLGACGISAGIPGWPGAQQGEWPLQGGPRAGVCTAPVPVPATLPASIRRHHSSAHSGFEQPCSQRRALKPQGREFPEAQGKTLISPSPEGTATC